MVLAAPDTLVGSGALAALAFAAGFLALGVWLFVSAKLLKARRRRFRTSREPLPDEAFLQKVGAEHAEATLFTALRQGAALVCDVPAEMIHDTDSIRALTDLTFDGWDPVGLVMPLEDALDWQLDIKELASLPSPNGRRFFFWAKQESFHTFGEWAGAAVRHLREHAAAHGTVGGPKRHEGSVG
ncbi:MAG: hypothetical protein ACW96M_08040 [Candidatus Thorarchaeota archaeon]|jgi:hypothetical protein